jgi:hypothetical protein
MDVLNNVKPGDWIILKIEIYKKYIFAEKVVNVELRGEYTIISVSKKEGIAEINPHYHRFATEEEIKTAKIKDMFEK